MNLELSPETIEDLQALARENAMSVEKVIESLVTFYQQNSVIELTSGEQALLAEGLASEEADRAMGFEGYTDEKVGAMIEETIAEYQRKHSQGAAF